MKSKEEHATSSNGENLSERCEYWNALFAEYYSHLMSFSVRLTGDPDDAEDLVQEVVCRVLKYVDRAAASEQSWMNLKSPAAYLRTVARHIHVDREKQRRYSQISLDDDDVEGLHHQLVDYSTSDAIVNRVYYEELMRSLPLRVFLAGLSGYELKLLHLNSVEEMTVREIAKELDEDASLIRYHLQKVHAKVRYRARTFMNEKMKFHEPHGESPSRTRIRLSSKNAPVPPSQAAMPLRRQ
jgi:RNA polymerase sigma-70 factor (ECF subfamily)